MGAIKLLSDSLINRIAAGEVVERPASVLKELVENSLDAGATRLEIQAEAGGRQRILVMDNGQGMSPDDLLLAVERHATSKISEETDLMTIATLGFRGEALPSIAAVSRLTITSADGNQGQGRQVHLSGGRIVEVREVGREQGTTVDMTDLFYNVPARRKFLKSQQTEGAHLLDVLQRYALGRPTVRFIYKHGGQELLAISPREDDPARLARVLGRETARRMFPFSGQVGGLLLSGFLGRPDLDRGRPDQLFLYVSGRPVKDRLLTRAVLDAYRPRLASGRYPVAVIFADMDHRQVDVNVHPAKTEVRFRHPEEVFKTTVQVINQALAQNLNAVFRPGPPKPVVSPATALWPPARVQESTLWEITAASPPGQFTPLDWPERRKTAESLPSQERARSRIEPGLEEQTTVKPAANLTPATSVPDSDYYAAGLMPIGQLFRAYMLAQGPDGLYIIDQHAAHERVLFEKLQADLALGPLTSQGLLMPDVVELTPLQAVAALDLTGDLRKLGFELEPFGGQAFVLRAAPAVVTPGEAARTLLEILESAVADGHTGTSLPSGGRPAFIQAWLATLACHGAIKAGQDLTRPEMDRLLADLARCQIPTNCPHGRPLIFSLDRGEIEKKFKR